MSVQPTGPPSPALDEYRKRFSSPARRYGSALLSVVIATLVRLFLTRWIGPTALPLLPYLPAIVFSAWFGGMGPGILSVLVSAVAADYFFIPPAFSFGIPPAELRILGAFLAGGICIAVLGETRRKAHSRGEASQELLATTLRSIGRWRHRHRY